MTNAEASQFEGFYSGAENQVPLAVVRTVARRPGTVYNPLFLYGPPGVGKTCLVDALAASLQKGKRPIRVARFALIAAPAEGGRRARRSQPPLPALSALRAPCVAIAEDLDQLSGVPEAQAEFVSVFDKLRGHRCQMVLTARQSPQALEGIPYRLRSRLASGLVLRLAPPGPAVRRALAEQFARRHQIPLPTAVSKMLADSLAGSLQELYRAIRLLDDAARLENGPISERLAASYLQGLQAPPPSLSCIAARVAEHFGIDVQALRSSARGATVRRARQLAIYLARTLTHSSRGTIAAFFHGLHPSAVSHACRKVSLLVERDPELRSTTEFLRRTLCPRVHSCRLHRSWAIHLPTGPAGN